MGARIAVEAPTELPRSAAESAPPEYTRRQTLKGSERYVTAELKAFEDRVLDAREKASAREAELYRSVLSTVAEQLELLQRAATAIASIDVLSNFAERADHMEWTEPFTRQQP